MLTINSSPFNLTVLLYGPGPGYLSTVTLTLEIRPWVAVMKHPWVMDNNCLKYYLDPTWKWGVMAWQEFWVCVHCDLDLGDITLSQGHGTALGNGQQLCEIWTRWDKGGKKLWLGQFVNRRTDRRADRVIPIYPQTLFGITNCDTCSDDGSLTYFYKNFKTSQNATSRPYNLATCALRAPLAHKQWHQVVEM